MTDELLAAEVAALVRELNGYMARATALGSGDEHDRFVGKAELVREQLRARGALAAKPSARANTRQRRGGETR